MTTRTMRRDRLEQLRNDTLVREATLPLPLDKKRCFFRPFFLSSGRDTVMAKSPVVHHDQPRVLAVSCVDEYVRSSYIPGATYAK